MTCHQSKDYRHWIARKTVEELEMALAEWSQRKRKWRGIRSVPSGRFHAHFASIYLGTFDTAEEAARAYDKRVLEVEGHGSVYKLNFPTMASIG